MARYVVQWCFLIPLLLGLLGTAASAQDGEGDPEPGSADLHGLTPAAPSADPADPLTLWAPPLRSSPRLGLFGLIEHGVNPVELKQDLVDADGRVVEKGSPLPLVPRVSGLDLSARWSPTWRLSVAITVPLIVLRYDNLERAGYPAGLDERDFGMVGEIRLAAPIGLVAPDGGEGFALGAIPFLNVPPGNYPFLHASGPTGGLHLAAGWRSDRIAGNLVLGALAGKAERQDNLWLRGPLTAQYGAALGARVSDRSGPGWWLGAEARGTADVPVGGGDLRRPPASAEVLATLRGSFGGAWIGAGGGFDALSGPGAAAGRGFVGGGYTLGGVEREPRVVPQWTFVVDDPQGAPVAGATVTNGEGLLGVTDPLGRLTVEQRAVRWPAGVAVSAERHLPSEVERPVDDAGDEIRVRLAWKPATVEAQVTDGDGNPVQIELVAYGEDGTELRGKPGELQLPPGTWRVELIPPSGSGLATQVRQVVVPASGAPPGEIEAVAIADQGGPATVRLRINDPDGGAIVGARILIDGLPVGTTGDGGYIEVAGLSEGTHAVVVQHESFTGDVLQLDLDADDPEATPVVLQRQPGTVRVAARTPDGAPVTDAIVRFLGPTRLAPMALGGSGERVQVLSPGDWVAVVSSAQHGVQERQVVVTPGRYELIEVLVVFQPAAEVGVAELDLRVIDPSGAPVEGAEILLDDATVGTTSTGGSVRLGQLAPGERQLTIRGPELVTVQQALVLAGGLQERVVTAQYEVGTVDVVVRGPDGTVRDAVVRFVGPSPQDQVEPGASGRVRRVLGAGRWTVVVSSGQYGIQERELVLDPDDRALHVVEVVLAPAGGGLAILNVRVVDPDGVPLDGLALLLDDAPVGRTSDGHVRLKGLDLGQHTIAVKPEPGQPLQAKTLPVRLLQGDNQVEIELDWVRHAVRVRVTSGGAPVTDAVVRLVSDEVTTPPLPVDAQGQRVIAADPGLWLALVSGSMGVSQEDFEVRSAALTTVDVELRPVDPSKADLIVRVTDPNGGPVDDPKVTVDGAKLGEGEVGGVVLARGLEPREVTIEASAPDFQTSTVAVTLRPGETERILIPLKWVPSPLVVRTYGPEGEPVDATVTFRGPHDVPEAASGERGQVDVELMPGGWSVYAAAGAVAAVGEIEIEIGDTPLPMLLELKPSGAVMAGESVEIEEMVQFDFDAATLRPDSEPILAEVARVLKSQPDIVRVEVQGHTDNVGSASVNATLSQARAEAVLEALVGLGVPRETLYARGYGQTRPVAPNDTDEGRAANRRVQFEVEERGALP